MVTEMIADVANIRLADLSYDTMSQHLYSLAANITLSEQPNVPFLDTAHTIAVPISYNQVWTPPSKLVSTIIFVLHRKQMPNEYLLVMPKNPSHNTVNGSTSPLNWA
jgi:hypothetical protein